LDQLEQLSQSGAGEASVSVQRRARRSPIKTRPGSRQSQARTVGQRDDQHHLAGLPELDLLPLQRVVPARDRDGLRCIRKVMGSL
jgi:hypothetical protein